MKNNKEIKPGVYFLKIPSNSKKKSDIHLKLEIVKHTISHLMIITENDSSYVSISNELNSDVIISQVNNFYK